MAHDPLVVSLRNPVGAPQAQQPAPPPPPPPPPRAKRRSGRLVKRLAMVIVLAFVAGTLWYAYAYTALFTTFSMPLSAGSETTSTEEVGDLIERVGLLIDLPVDEEPTVATVSDPEKLKDQPFFANAKVGDKVLLYTKARKAYLYDPVRHKLIEVAPITTEMQQ